MLSDLGVDMDRSSKPNGNSKPSPNTSKPVINSAQTERQKEPQAYPRNPRKNKPNPQKYRSCQDKRPQARSYGGNTETYRGKTAYESESGFSAFCDEKKQKKVNLNHLLNFTYNTAVVSAPAEDYGHGRKYSRQRTCTLPRYNKELYLQATCQFVVKAGGDYTVHSVDPDYPVEWDLVEQVRINSAHVPSCPICLYPPTAGKIAKCGHVFCFSCILHYLALSDKPWRKCPICYDAVDRKSLKSLAVVGLQEFKVGDEIRLQLMRRERNSTVIVPHDGKLNFEHGSEPKASASVSCDDADLVFAKILTATPAEVLDKIVGPEEATLKVQLKEDGNEPEACFIEEALTLVADRKQELAASPNLSPVVEAPTEVASYPESRLETAAPSFESTSAVPPGVKTLVYASAFHETVEETSPTGGNSGNGSDPEAEAHPTGAESDEFAERNRNVSECSSGLESLPENYMSPEDLDISGLDLETAMDKELESPGGKPSGTCRQAGARPLAPRNTFYFFQSADGQPIYMHALNVRMLVAQYGSLERCPPIITAKIVELESTNMTAELRDRLRYLQHLTISTAFQVAEVRLTGSEPDSRSPQPSLVSRDTLRMFRDELEERRRRRVRRARVEQRRERRICEQQTLSFAPPGFAAGASGGVNFELDSASDNFDYNADFAPLPTAASPEALVPAHVESAAVNEPVSFAKMLKEGKQMPPRAPVNVGLQQNSGILTLRRRPTGNGDADDDDVELPAPAYRESLGDAIAIALARADKLKKPEISDVRAAGTQSTENSGKKKKKSGKGIVLFQTSMARGSGK